MSLIAEIHVLQQFAPANLNRDDTGSPKDAFFGGVRRARISSQSIKRAVRRFFSQMDLLDRNALGVRTKKLVEALAERLQGKVADPIAVAKAVIEAAGLKLTPKGGDGNGKDVTDYLLFIGFADLDALVSVGVKYESRLKDAGLKKEVGAEMRTCRAADVAMFGRMVADNKDFSVDAACQVAHAISTHRVEKEFDYFTAVDDLAADDESGAGMIGTVEFNSACYYRYALVNLDLLYGNLAGDPELVPTAAQAFAEAFALATPTGKQNTFAAHNPPEFVAIRLRRNATPCNLANAFERPITSRDGYLKPSVLALASQWAKLDGAFGPAGKSWVVDLTGAWTGEKLSSLKEAVDQFGKQLIAEE